jgi:hypothetical protein
MLLIKIFCTFLVSPVDCFEIITGLPLVSVAEAGTKMPVLSLDESGSREWARCFFERLDQPVTATAQVTTAYSAPPQHLNWF